MSDPRDLDLQAQKDFEYTQSIRRQMVGTLTQTGPLPNDKNNTQILLQTMRDMDAQNIARLRVKVDEKANDNMAGMAGMVSGILREIRGGESVGGLPAPNQTVIDVGAKMLPDSIPKPVAVPGEMSVDPPQLNYGDFVKRMKED